MLPGCCSPRRSRCDRSARGSPPGTRHSRCCGALCRPPALHRAPRSGGCRAARRAARRERRGACGYHNPVKIIVLGAGVVGVASAWYLAAAGHEVTVIDRQAGAGLETSFANGGQIAAGHAEPWAKPSVVPKILGWLGREDAPPLFRPRASWAQWSWGLRFLYECLPGRFERHSRTLASLAGYSRECLRALRGELGLSYDQLERGILTFATNRRDFDAIAHHAEVTRRKVLSGAECLAL